NKLYNAKRLKLREPIKRPKIIASEDVERILKACKNSRDQFLIYLLYETGMRIGEALSLHREDIKFGARKISIRDRGELENDAEIKTSSSERTLDVTPDLMNLYDEYFFDYLDSDEVDTDFVFINITGKKRNEPMTYQAVNSLIKRLREETGVQFSAHVLRHTCLTELWRTKKIRPEILKARAGHKQIQTTLQMYVHPSKEDIAKEWAEAIAEKQKSEDKNVK
ncbi:MAG: tyrosine-type recombinase/integrase, partial [Bacillus sp. (in: firmicutes)]